MQCSHSKVWLVTERRCRGVGEGKWQPEERNSQESPQRRWTCAQRHSCGDLQGQTRGVLGLTLAIRSLSCCCFYVLGKLGCVFAILHEHEDRNGGFYASPLKICMWSSAGTHPKNNPSPSASWYQNSSIKRSEQCLHLTVDSLTEVSVNNWG